MASIPVVVKHQGKKHNLDLDPTSTGEDFKLQVYSLTGVEPERQKILVKGGQLKDDTDLSTLKVKPGHMFMMMGTPSGDASGVLEKPKEKIRFLEDMTEAEAAQIDGAVPSGLKNLGNTCYMNATVQALRSIPELQQELSKYNSGGSGTRDRNDAFSQLLGGSSLSTDLTASLRDLLKHMSETQDSFNPMAFLNSLRSTFPQFAQRSRDGHGYAQQDAEEAWSQVISQVRQKLNIKEKDGEVEREKPFVDKYMAGSVESVMECDEPAAKEGGEEPVKSKDNFLKLNCHISAETNHLRDGIANGLVEKIEKKSSVLDRDAVYTKTSKVTRLPKYLTVHFMRFDWRRDTNKKAKIMRKVTFPQELDVVEFCSEDLQKKLIPARNKFREVRGIAEDAERARKRQKRMKDDAARALPAEEKPKAKNEKKEKDKKDEDTEMEGVTFKTDAEIEAETAANILNARKELLALLTQEEIADQSTNHTGLYELRAIVTHQGASADSGHYTAFVKKAAKKDPVTGKEEQEDSWWWFNDDKVTEFESDRIETLAGGGQSHSALILLYRAVPLPTAEQVAE